MGIIFPDILVGKKIRKTLHEQNYQVFTVFFSKFPALLAPLLAGFPKTPSIPIGSMEMIYLPLFTQPVYHKNQPIQ